MLIELNLGPELIYQFISLFFIISVITGAICMTLSVIVLEHDGSADLRGSFYMFFAVGFLLNIILIRLLMVMENTFHKQRHSGTLKEDKAIVE